MNSALQQLVHWIKSHTFLIFSLALNIILCFCLMSNCKGRDPVINTEYIPVHDTITVTQERIIEKTNTVFIKDTLLKVDSIYVEKDGTFVELPMEWKQYKDTIKNDSSEARIGIKYHGIAADIDSIQLNYMYNKEIQTIIKQPKKYGLGVCVGPTITYGWGYGSPPYGNLTVGIGVTIGLDYRFEIK